MCTISIQTCKALCILFYLLTILQQFRPVFSINQSVQEMLTFLATYAQDGGTTSDDSFIRCYSSLNNNNVLIYWHLKPFNDYFPSYLPKLTYIYIYILLQFPLFMLFIYVSRFNFKLKLKKRIAIL